MTDADVKLVAIFTSVVLSWTRSSQKNTGSVRSSNTFFVTGFCGMTASWTSIGAANFTVLFSKTVSASNTSESKTLCRPSIPYAMLRYLSTDRKIYYETLQWTQLIYLKISNITLVTKELLLNNISYYHTKLSLLLNLSHHWHTLRAESPSIFLDNLSWKIEGDSARRVPLTRTHGKSWNL